MSILSWTFLIYEIFFRNRRLLYLSGMVAGLSILTHQLNVVFLIAAIFLLSIDKTYFKLRLLSFFSMVFFTLLFGFILFGIMATSSIFISDLFQWLRGYVGNSEFGIYFRLDSIPIAVKTALSAVIPGSYGGLRLIRLAIYVVLVAPILIGITQVKYLDRMKKMIMFSAIIHCSINFLLIVWFEPFYTPFWLLTFVPGLILYGTALRL
jgi:hypothetical protein